MFALLSLSAEAAEGIGPRMIVVILGLAVLCLLFVGVMIKPLRTKLPAHVLMDVLKTFGFAVGIFTAVVVLFGVVQEAVRQGLPLYHALRLVPYVLPDALCRAIPVTLLLAVTRVYSRLSQDNEIIAIKAMGISPWSVIWPVLMVSFALGAVTVWLYDVAVSWGREGAKSVVIGAVEEIAYGMLRSEGAYEARGFSVSVTDVQDRRLIRPVFRQTEGRAEVTFEAEEAILECDSAKGMLKITLRDAVVDRNGDMMTFPGVHTHEIPLTDASKKSQRIGHPSDTPLSEVGDAKIRQEGLISEFDRELATRAAFDMAFGRSDVLNTRTWARQNFTRRELVHILNRLNTEPHRRFAWGFSCFFFVWVGIPVAIYRKQADFMTSFFLCFAPILLIYFPLLLVSLDMAKKGDVAPWAVWGGNVVLLLIGAWVFRKVMRH